MTFRSQSSVIALENGKYSKMTWNENKSPGKWKIFKDEIYIWIFSGKGNMIKKYEIEQSNQEPGARYVTTHTHTLQKYT